ncbi:hypothetical protein CPB86DRAFT_785955 [Serendipita vermifera]|nr:hypothetical protein CPB86DRAFT_785955 [Serendipita vermifera]
MAAQWLPWVKELAPVALEYVKGSYQAESEKRLIRAQSDSTGVFGASKEMVTGAFSVISSYVTDRGKLSELERARLAREQTEREHQLKMEAMQRQYELERKKREFEAMLAAARIAREHELQKERTSFILGGVWLCIFFAAFTALALSYEPALNTVDGLWFYVGFFLFVTYAIYLWLGSVLVYSAACCFIATIAVYYTQSDVKISIPWLLE